MAGIKERRSEVKKIRRSDRGERAQGMGQRAEMKEGEKLRR